MDPILPAYALLLWDIGRLFWAVLKSRWTCWCSGWDHCWCSGWDQALGPSHLSGRPVGFILSAMFNESWATFSGIVAPMILGSLALRPSTPPKQQGEDPTLRESPVSSPPKDPEVVWAGH